MEMTFLEFDKSSNSNSLRRGHCLKLKCNTMDMAPVSALIQIQEGQINEVWQCLEYKSQLKNRWSMITIL